MSCDVKDILISSYQISQNHNDIYVLFFFFLDILFLQHMTYVYPLKLKSHSIIFHYFVSIVRDLGVWNRNY